MSEIGHMATRLILILFLFACNKSLVPSQEDTPDVNEILDISSPTIQWIFPQFDAVLQGEVVILCQVTDISGIDSLELYIDSLNSGLVSIPISDSTYEFHWQTGNYDNVSEHSLSLYAIDNFGNAMFSNNNRVIIDNTHFYPQTNNISIDSLFNDTTFTGYKLTWSTSNDNHFSKYILEKSVKPLMEYHEIFFSEDRSITSFADITDNHDDIIYYRLTIINQFGYMNSGDVISTSMKEMPLSWNVHSVLYTSNSVEVNWYNPPFDGYNFHKLVVSEERTGDYELLITYTEDSPQTQFISGEFEPKINNWFSIITGDDLGQETRSTPYIHPTPKAPIIDSVFYENNSFMIRWEPEPATDFSNYQILYASGEDPYNLSESVRITNSANYHYEHSISESEYFLYQIITQDAWGLESRGQVVIASSFTKFVTRIDNGHNDSLFALTGMENGDFISAGQIYNGNFSGWVIVTDNKGNELWQKTFENGTNAGFRDITRTPNNNYILTGYKYSPENNNNLWLIKINENGNKVWDKEFGGQLNDGGTAITYLEDNTIGVTGYYNVNTSNQDVFVIKISIDNGEEIWRKNFGGSESDVGYDIIPSDDGGIFVLGTTFSQGDPNGDIWLLKLNADGDLVDSLSIGGTGYQAGYSFVKTDDNGFSIAGMVANTNGATTDVLVIKINNDWDIDWIFQYGGSYNDYSYAIDQFENGWIVAGQTYSQAVGAGDAWLLYINKVGQLEWEKTYGSNYNEGFSDVGKTPDEGIIMCGSSYIAGANQIDGWLIKTDSKGNYKGYLNYMP